MKLPFRYFSLIISFITLFITTSCSQTNKQDNLTTNFKAVSNAEWKKRLTPEQYYILREKGTERAFSGKYWDHHEQGVYHCAACDLPLFDSKTKFESGSGWPSFYQPLTKTSVELEKDSSFGMIRDEVVCHRCGGHLGHVFEDGPAPTGLRYCLNSEALSFHKKQK
jgi:peptide-methionine (R)-S-oxide reductase